MLEFETKGRKCEMKFLEADVKRPLGSVADIMDGGNRVVFQNSGSYIENEKSGEKLWMERRGGTFVLALKGMKAKADAKKKVAKDDMEVEGVDDDYGDFGMDEKEWEKIEKMVKDKMGEGELVFRRRVQ